MMVLNFTRYKKYSDSQLSNNCIKHFINCLKCFSKNNLSEHNISDNYTLFYTLYGKDIIDIKEDGCIYNSIIISAKELKNIINNDMYNNIFGKNNFPLLKISLCKIGKKDFYFYKIY